MKTREQWKDEAYQWASDYMCLQEDIEFCGVFEGMTDDQWSEHLEFITDCIEKGVKPTHFIDVLIEAQQSFNSLFNEQVDEEDE